MKRNFTIELNDRGSSVISIVADGRTVVSASFSNMMFSDYGSSREFCLAGTDIGVALKDKVSTDAVESLIGAINNDSADFEFEDSTCCIW